MAKITSETLEIMRKFRSQTWAPNVEIVTKFGIFIPTADVQGVLWEWSGTNGDCRARIREKNFQTIDPKTFCLILKLLRMQHEQYKKELSLLIEALYQEFAL